MKLINKIFGLFISLIIIGAINGCKPHQVIIKGDYPALEQKKFYTTKLKATKINKIENNDNKIIEQINSTNENKEETQKRITETKKLIENSTKEVSDWKEKINISKALSSFQQKSFEQAFLNLLSIDSSILKDNTEITYLLDSLDTISKSIAILENEFNVFNFLLDSLKININNITNNEIEDFRIEREKQEIHLLKKLDELNKNLQKINMKLEPYIKNNEISLKRLSIFYNNHQYNFLEKWDIKGFFPPGEFELSKAEIDKEEITKKVNEIIKYYKIYTQDTSYKDLKFEIILHIEGYSDTQGFSTKIKKGSKTTRKKELEQILSNCLPEEYKNFNISIQTDTLNYCLSKARANEVMNYITNLMEDKNIKIKNPKIYGKGYELPDKVEKSDDKKDDKNRRIAKIFCYIISR